MEILKHSALSCNRLKSDLALAVDLTTEPAVPSGSVWLGSGNSTASRERRWSPAPSWAPGAAAAAGARCGMEQGGSGGLPEAPGTVLAVPEPPRGGCANGTGAEIPSSTMCGWAQGHLVRLRGRGAVRGDGGDGDGGSGGVFALSVCLCCRALTSGPPGDPAAVWCLGKGCRGCASTSASALATSPF